MREASDLDITKRISPIAKAYYPLDDFNITLSASARNTITVNPILIDMLPKCLRYITNSEYFLYYDRTTGVTYDSSQPNFPIALPTRDVIKDFKGTTDTFVVWRCNNLILP